ncbi:unnamed protein product [Clonostachys rosea f. rosea IK726]|uniref:Rhodopsin domain-containing protein n=2 Tax=Bionectria ochroleuca TaxID=29856 RepID=A0A0B7KBJ0_BIOOC|nr:unnamed protein product [Clonostachys rosea f. rosea IK726]
MEDNKGPAIKAACITLWTLGTVFVCLRLFTRKHIMKNVQVDDYLIILATAFGWANAAMAIVAVAHGSGRHTDTLTLGQQGNAKLFTILSFPFGILSFTIPKLAVVTLLTRLLNPSRVRQAFLWSLAWLCLISVIICIIILFTQCTPAAFMWGGAPEGKCISPWVLINFSIFTGALSAFTDLCLAIYPAVILWGLQINIRKKTALSVALGIGSISCGVAIYKSTRLDSLASLDFVYDTADLVIWTAAEATSTVIACCIPILQPLVEILFGRKILSGSSSSYKNYDYHNDRYGRSGDMELSKIGRSGIQHTVTSHTIGTRSGDPDLDSKESILPKDNKGADGQNPKMHSRHITRTDVITVTYGDRATIDSEQKDLGVTTAV